jgi:hypothetical protein
MKVVPFLVLALVACKSNKPAAPAATGSAAAVVVPVPKAAPAAPEVPKYTPPEAPDDEVVPVQAQEAGSAVAKVVPRDPVVRQFDKLDADHDGKLTPAEVEQMYGDDVDANGDGEISKDELSAAMREARIHARASVVR